MNKEILKTTLIFGGEKYCHEDDINKELLMMIYKYFDFSNISQQDLHINILSTVEKELLKIAFKKNRYCIAKTARSLSVNRGTLTLKLRKYEITRDRFEDNSLDLLLC